MVSVATGDDLCAVALQQNINWTAIEAYDASPRGSKRSEVEPLAIPVPALRHLFAGSNLKEGVDADTKLIDRFDVICRFCLEEKDFLMDIFGLSHQAVVVVESLGNIKIEPEDMLPKHICTNCYELLSQCLAFKQQVASTDTALRRCINRLKQIEIESKEQILEASTLEVTEQHILDVTCTYNEWNEGHKFEEIRDEEDYPVCDDTVYEKAENFYSEHDEKPVVDEGDAIVHAPEVQSEPVTSQREVMLPSANEQRKTKTPVKCELCDRAFSSHSLLQRHVKSHTTKKLKNQFRVSSKSFCPETELKSYVPSHTTRNENAKEQTNTTLSGEKPHKCSHCSKTFRLPSTLANHVRTHTGEKPFKCSHCTKSFGQSSTLAAHVRTHTGEKPYKCPHCSKSFGDFSVFAVHLRIHTGEKPYKCSHCSKTFRTSSKLADHVRTHTGEKRFKCSHCSKAFTTSSMVADHVRTHTGEKPYKCPHCTKSFIRPSTLADHVRTHTGEKPYKCVHCSKPCASYTTLIKHVRTHSGERPHKCSHCSKTFRSPSTLMDHVRTHTGEKPFKCSHCSKDFRASSTLADHLRTHTGEKPYKCPHCTKSFGQSSTLTVHVRTHTNEKPYKCAHCIKAFRSSASLVYHAKTHITNPGTSDSQDNV